MLSEIERKGVLQGIHDPSDLVVPLDKHRLQTKDQPMQLEQFEFALDDPEEELKQVEEKIYEKMTNQNRYENEFRKNKGIIALTGDRFHIFQCFISIDLYVKKVMTEEQKTAFGKDFLRVLIKVF